MPEWDETARVSVGDVDLELPAALIKNQADPIDSTTAVFEGPGITVIVDQGPFADRLDSHVGAPGYAEHVTTIAESTRRTVSFRNPEDGTCTVGTHLAGPKPLTVVVRASDSVPHQITRDILSSLRLRR